MVSAPQIGISLEEAQRRADAAAAFESAHAWKDESIEAADREYAWYCSYPDIWGVMLHIRESRWARWLIWFLLIPAYASMRGRRFW